MKKLFLLTILLMSVIWSYGQQKSPAIEFVGRASTNFKDNPRKITHYDTIKITKQLIEYLPDTIPVYFKEVVISRPDSIPSNMGKAEITSSYSYTVYEVWRKGFVIWQTYRKPDTAIFYADTTFNQSFIYKQPEYYTDPYEPSKSIPGTFLYADKTQCKNLVIYSIKR